MSQKRSAAKPGVAPRVPRTNPPAGKLRPLNRPRPVRVRLGGAGVPVSLEIRGRWRRIGDVLDQWRIDDEWWREPISRAYFSIVLENGAHLTAYRDLMLDRWFLQPE